VIPNSSAALGSFAVLVAIPDLVTLLAGDLALLAGCPDRF
jgi:hypothetical protein